MTKPSTPSPPTPQTDASRRTVLAAGLSAAVGAAAGGGASPSKATAAASQAKAETGNASTLSFAEVPHTLAAGHEVSPGHNVQVLLRWGDALTDAAPAWMPHTQSAAAQQVQFGYDNDFIAFKPLPYGSNSSVRGLLCVNHESTRGHLMFPTTAQGKAFSDIEIAAQGFSVVEVFQENGAWAVNLKSPYNRRITAATEIDITGPAAGHPRMRTRDDPTGRLVLGTFANCAGGETPWGTVLTAEENIHLNFGGDPSGTSEAANHRLMGFRGRPFSSWHLHYPRFNVETEPHEPNRFAWMVEIDPYRPELRPAKRTALGRFKHEGAGVALNPDGRVVCYMGDDEVFQYIYKFVSRRAMDRTDRTKNWGLLDEGTLFAARFNADQTVTWLPLTFGEGPLTAANGFSHQAEVVIDARRAASLVGATPMDRPEDIDVNTVTNTVFVALSKNARRSDANVDAANPRSANRHGHIMEILPGTDHAATTSRWQMLLLAGDPADEKSQAQYHPGVSENGWLSNPDNFAVDTKGRLWIGTDGANDFGYADGLWATDVVGGGRALTRLFFSCPIGGELTGPAFTPDGTTLFCSVQHPGDTGNAAESNFATPATRWPDFQDGVPPRPSVIAIRASDGKPIG